MNKKYTKLGEAKKLIGVLDNPDKDVIEKLTQTIENLLKNEEYINNLITKTGYWTCRELLMSCKEMLENQQRYLETEVKSVSEKEGYIFIDILQNSGIEDRNLTLERLGALYFKMGIRNICQLLVACVVDKEIKMYKELFDVEEYSKSDICSYLSDIEKCNAIGLESQLDLLEVNSIFEIIKSGNIEEAETWEQVFLDFFLKEEDSTIDEKAVEKSNCVSLLTILFFFFYFRVKNTYAGNRIEFLELLLFGSGLNINIHAYRNMEDIILLYTAKINEDFTYWTRQRLAWKNILSEEKITPNLQLGEVSDSNYALWRDNRINLGCEIFENERITRNSILIMSKEVAEWEGFPDSSEVDDRKRNKSIEIMRYSFDAEMRRLFYFNRILSHIIDAQNSPYYEENKTVQRYILLEGEKIIIDKVTIMLNTFFDGIDLEEEDYREKCALAKCRPRQTRAIDSGRLYANQLIKNRMNDAKVDTPDIFRSQRSSINSIMLNNEKTVSRELILMMILILKVFEPTKWTLNYIAKHVLFNCRFNTELRDTQFDLYFKETFLELEKIVSYEDVDKRIKLLQSKSFEFERDYLCIGKEPFNRFVLNKEI